MYKPLMPWCAGSVVAVLLGGLPEGLPALEGEATAVVRDEKRGSPLDKLDRTAVPNRLPKEVVAVIPTDGNDYSDFKPCTFSPDGSTLVAPEGSGHLRFWRLGKHQPEKGQLLEVGVGVVSALAISPDGKALAVSGDDRTLEVWDIGAEAKLRSTFADPDGLLWALTFSPSGDLLAGVTMRERVEGTVHLWNVGGGQATRRCRLGHTNAVRLFTFAPDGRTLAVADRAGVVLWEVGTGRERTRFSNPAGWVAGVCFVEGGRGLKTVDECGTVRRWSLSSGDFEEQGKVGSEQEEAVLSSSGRWATSFPSRGGIRIFSHIDHTVTLWEAPGKAACESRLPGGVQKMTWAPDGRHLAVMHFEGYIFILRFPR